MWCVSALNCSVILRYVGWRTVLLSQKNGSLLEKYICKKQGFSISMISEQLPRVQIWKTSVLFCIKLTSLKPMNISLTHQGHYKVGMYALYNSKPIKDWTDLDLRIFMQVIRLVRLREYLDLSSRCYQSCIYFAYHNHVVVLSSPSYTMLHMSQLKFHCFPRVVFSFMKTGLRFACIIYFTHSLECMLEQTKYPLIKVD